MNSCMAEIVGLGMYQTGLLRGGCWVSIIIIVVGFNTG